MNKDIYFEYNGVKYYVGTKFKMKEPKYKANIVEAVFWGTDIFFDGELSIMYEDWNFGKMCRYFIHVKPEDLPGKIIEITEGNYYTELEARKRYTPDSKIPELFFCWIIYLIIMAILFIFKDRLIGWIAVSIYFFYKRKKIKEGNYYYK